MQNFCVVLATPTQNHHIIMPPRRKNNTLSGTSARKCTTAAKDTATAAATAAVLAATAASAAEATSTNSTASAQNPPLGCLTSAAARLGIPPIVGIPNPNLQNLAKPPDFDNGKFVGSCNYHVGETCQTVVSYIVNAAF